MKGAFLLIILFLFLSGECQTDLSALFAPPTVAEIQAVKEEWASRNLPVVNWQILGSGTITGLSVDVVSHEVDGNTHYGFVRYPLNYNPNNSYPVLVANHGAQSGVGAGIIIGYSTTDCLKEFIVVVPSFRSEELRTESLGFGNYISEGTPSEFDGDIDDAISLLNGVLENVAGADENRISVAGGSRGGGVSYLMSIRDPRIKMASIFFGATDHITHPGMQAAVENHIDNGSPIAPPFNTAVVAAAEPYLEGNFTLEEARMALIRRSAIYFIEHLPRHECHAQF